MVTSKGSKTQTSASIHAKPRNSTGGWFTKPCTKESRQEFHVLSCNLSFTGVLPDFGTRNGLSQNPSKISERCSKSSLGVRWLRTFTPSFNSGLITFNTFGVGFSRHNPRVKNRLHPVNFPEHQPYSAINTVPREPCPVNRESRNRSRTRSGGMSGW